MVEPDERPYRNTDDAKLTRALLMKDGATQEKLAKAMGVSRRQIARWSAGEQRPSKARSALLWALYLEGWPKLTYEQICQRMSHLEPKVIDGKASPSEIEEYVGLKRDLAETPEGMAIEAAARAEVERLLGRSII